MKLIANQDLEMAILGALIMDGVELPDGLTVEDFINPQHQKVFAAIKKQAIAGKPYDGITLKAAGFDGQLVASLMDTAAIGARLSDYATEVKNLSFRRRFHKITQQLQVLAEEGDDVDPALMLDRGMSMLGQIETRTAAADERTGIELITNWEELQLRRAAGQEKGLSTGFPEIDAIVRSMRGGQMIVVAGRTGMGKTVLASDIALSVIEQGKAVLFAEFELGFNEVADRFISMRSSVPIEKLETGYVDQDIVTAKEFLFHNRLKVLAQSTYEIHDFKARTKKLKRWFEKQGHELGVVIIDLMAHLRSPNSRESSEQQVAYVSRQVKIMAQEIDVPVIAVCQCNRGSENRSNPRPRISDIRGSGGIEQDADIVVLMYRPEYYLDQIPRAEWSEDQVEYHKKIRGVCEVNIGKHRQGKTGVAFLKFEGECTRLTSTKRSEVDMVQQAFNAEVVDESF